MKQMVQTTLWLFILALLNPLLPQTQAADAKTKIAVQLVWGTDNEKPKAKAKEDLKEVDAKLKRRLQRVFKWKNYFVVNRKSVDLSDRRKHKIVMSPKCYLITRLVDGAVEIELYGEEQFVKKVKHPVPGDLLVLAGDDKNDTAWFVVVEQVKE